MNDQERKVVARVQLLQKSCVMNQDGKELEPHSRKLTNPALLLFTSNDNGHNLKNMSENVQFSIRLYFV